MRAQTTALRPHSHCVKNVREVMAKVGSGVFVRSLLTPSDSRSVNRHDQVSEHIFCESKAYASLSVKQFDTPT